MLPTARRWWRAEAAWLRRPRWARWRCPARRRPPPPGREVLTMATPLVYGNPRHHTVDPTGASFSTSGSCGAPRVGTRYSRECNGATLNLCRPRVRHKRRDGATMARTSGAPHSSTGLTLDPRVPTVPVATTCEWWTPPPRPERWTPHQRRPPGRRTPPTLQGYQPGIMVQHLHSCSTLEGGSNSVFCTGATTGIRRHWGRGQGAC